MKKLVAYFSATGTTQTLAENLANGLMFIFFCKEPNSSVKYRFEKGTPFQKQVWHLIENIDLAKRLAMATLLALLQGKWKNKKCLPKQLGKQLVQIQFA